MRALGRAPQGVGSLARVVFANVTARLHRGDDNTVVDELEHDAVARSAHRLCHCSAVADLPVEAEVAWCLITHQRLSRLYGANGVDRGWEWLVVDRDQLRSIPRRGEALRHHHRDRVADMPH